jgi:C-terminal processing protease CtpA/Prc
MGTKGDNASTRYDGLLGGAIFRRFKMTVDLRNKRLYLEPNARLAEPFETDMSGLSLVVDDDLTTIMIDEVRSGSAAAKAGVVGGETIKDINGRKATELGLQEITRMMRTAGEYDLTVLRNGREITIHLHLERII